MTSRTIWGIFCAILLATSTATSQPDSLWSRTFGGSNSDVCWSVQQTTDGGYILGGETWSFGATNNNFWLVKTDSLGDSLWSRTFGGYNTDYCYSIQQTTDGGYVLGGMTSSYGSGGFDFWLVKTDASGTGEWSRTFGGISDDRCYSVQQSTDGGYVLGGRTESFSAGDYDFWLVKTDVSGTEEWSRTFGGSRSDYCRSVQQTTDGGYILGGHSESYVAGNYDIWLVKTDASGAEEWSRTFGGISDDRCYSVQQTIDGGYIVGGTTESYVVDDYDFWLMKTEADPLAADPIMSSLPDKYVLLQNYPNPFNPSTQISFDLTKASHVSVKVFDLIGREVRVLVNEVQPTGNHSITFDGSSLPSGIYLYRLQAGDFSTTKKMVLLK